MSNDIKKKQLEQERNLFPPFLTYQKTKNKKEIEKKQKRERRLNLMLFVFFLLFIE